MHESTAEQNARGCEPEPLLICPRLTPAAEAIEKGTSSQLEHALDGHRRGLKVYESLKSLNEVIGTQYGERTLFELLQNAHDAHAAVTWLRTR